MSCQECCCYFSEKYLLEQARDQFRVESWKGFFLRQRNIYVFGSLKFWGGTGSQSQPSREVKAMFIFSQARQGAFHLGYQQDLRAEWPSYAFRTCVFNSMNGSELSLKINEARYIPPACSRISAICVLRILWWIYVWSQKSEGVTFRIVSSFWDLLLFWDSDMLWMGGRCSYK